MAEHLRNINLQRAIVQQLQSLASAGVTDLPAPDPETLERIKTAAQASTSVSAIPTPSTVRSESPPPSTKVTPTPVTNRRLLTEGYDTESQPLDARVSALQVLRDECAACTKCGELATSRTQTVFGVGNPQAKLCFFGEAPGADEDRLGEPFVGKAGQLLTKIIEACTLTRDDVYILNVLRCRPPGNRNPTAEEASNCRYFFESQLELIQPEFICCLGSIAATTLLEKQTSIGRLRGTFHSWRGAKVLATYHPAYLLRNPSAKKHVWDDMKLLMAEMGIPLPTKSG